jgi:uncharacterized DUF497 family protein
VIYEWDAAKAIANLKKHDISFEEAALVFQDPFAVTFEDPDHSAVEEREITIGRSTKQRTLFVAHCLRDNRVRIISARKATRRERKQYEQGFGKGVR